MKGRYDRNKTQEVSDSTCSALCLFRTLMVFILPLSYYNCNTIVSSLKKGAQNVHD